MKTSEVVITSDGIELGGTLMVPDTARGVVVFAHGSGSGRHSLRNRAVAEALADSGFATLLFDLLTESEERSDAARGHLRFDIDFLSRRLEDATRWTAGAVELSGLPLGYFGASTGAGAALVAAARLGRAVSAIVSRGGRPDLAGRAHLELVTAPTLLIVGALDPAVLELNEDALSVLRCSKRLDVVPGATHLFEEEGALDEVAELAGAWFGEHLTYHIPKP